MKYNTVTVREICNYITSGGTPSSTVENYYVPAQIPWLKTKEVNYSRIYETENYISCDGLEHSSAKLIPENSVIVAMYGQGDTAGRVAINKIPLTTNQACCNLVIDAKKADYNYVYYALSDMYEKLVSLKNGGAQPNLNAKIIGNIKIELPDITVQRRVVDILSAYDDLIENNRKQIKLLEEAAQRLYKEWFVDLRFPGWETTEIVDGVPVGWKKARVSDAASLLRRGISPKYNEEGNSWVINQKCIRQTVMDISEARKQEKNFAEEMQLLDSDTVICSTGAGTLGRVGQVFGSYERTTFDSHVTVVRANNAAGKQWLFQLLKSHQAHLQEQGKGSTNQLELYKGVIENLNILVPPSAIMQSFENYTQPIHDRITASKDCISRLQNARDIMLPKLMSGKLEV